MWSVGKIDVAFNQDLGDDMGTHRQRTRQRDRANGNANNQAEPLQYVEAISVSPHPDRTASQPVGDGRTIVETCCCGYPKRIVPNPIVSLEFRQHAGRLHTALGAKDAPRVAQMLDNGMGRKPELAGNLLGFKIAVDEAQAFALPLVQTGKRQIIHFGAIYQGLRAKSLEGIRPW